MLSDQFNLKVGLTKIPLTRANLDECFSPLSSERSAFVYSPFGTDATKNSRDMGIVAHGNFFENHMKYWFAVMEGRDGSAEIFCFHSRLHTSASVMPADDDIFYGQYFHSILDNRQAVRAGMDDHVGYIAVHE